GFAPRESVVAVRHDTDGDGGGLGDGGRASTPVMHSPAVMQTTQAVLELRHGEIKRGVEVTRGCLGSNGGPSALAGDLHPLAVLGLPAVGFVEQLHVEADDLPVVPLQADQLLFDMHPVMLGNLDVAALYHDVHTRPPSPIASSSS